MKVGAVITDYIKQLGLNLPITVQSCQVNINMTGQESEESESEESCNIIICKYSRYSSPGSAG